jgi:hypothetical protein
VRWWGDRVKRRRIEVYLRWRWSGDGRESVEGSERGSGGEVEGEGAVKY